MATSIVQKSAFREYDIRGIVGSEIPVEATYDLACSIIAYMLSHDPSIKTISVGMDGRTHSPLIKEHVCAAIVDSGLDVQFLGLCPTPALYFSLHTMAVQAGIMITASHNPAEYNGLKLCLGKENIWGNQIREMYHWYQAGKTISAHHKGKEHDSPIHESYCTWLATHFQHLHSIDLPIVVDCGNGTAGTVFPELINMLNIRSVKFLYQDVDGISAHHEADPTVEKNMQDVRNILAQ